MVARKLALLIGNSEYDDSRLFALPKSKEDVLAFAKVLRDPKIGNFGTVETEFNPTLAVALRKIARFFQDALADDLLLLYFSGHGLLDDHDEPYLAVHDSDKLTPFGSAIDRRFLTGAMDRSRSRQQVFILDSCYAGEFTRTKGTNRAAIAYKGNGSGRIILAATDEEAPLAYADGPDEKEQKTPYSVFTRYLVEGMGTGAADKNGRGYITVNDLFDYTRERAMNDRISQRPSFWADSQQGEIVIASSPNLRLGLPEAVQTALEKDDPAGLIAAVDELDSLLQRGDRSSLHPAARSVLTELSRHKSRLVAKAAADCLLLHSPPTTRTPVPTGHANSRVRVALYVLVIAFILLCGAMLWKYLHSDGLYLYQDVGKYQPLTLKNVYPRGKQASFRNGIPGTVNALAGFCAAKDLTAGTMLSDSNVCICGDLCTKK